MTRRLVRLLALVSVVSLGSCTWFLPKPDFKPYDPIAVVPQDFLFNTYAPLNDWLDQAVYVRMTNVPLIDVFEHPALRMNSQTLNHRWANRPRGRPLVTMYRVAITRRQLLWSLGHDYKLTLIPVIVPGGRSYIEIRARAS